MVILGVLMVFVIPKFKEIFSDMLGDTPLPILTRFVLNVSEAVTQQGIYVIGAIAALVIAIKMLAKTKVGSELLDRLKLSAPIFGDLMRKSAIAQFTSTLGTLLTGGVPMLSALNIVRDIAGNKVLIRAIQQVHDSVKEGETVAGPLEASGVFPSMVVSMIQVGEETGALPDMLMRIASNYEDEVDTAVDAMTSIIEPILIIFLAVIVGTIVIAMFMPLISIVGNLSG
jgi:type IV pilus assembly protein PilC